MTVYISCPNCKEDDIIEANVRISETESEVVEYPTECPNCKHPIDNDMIADLQWTAYQEQYFGMLDRIYETKTEWKGD